MENKNIRNDLKEEINLLSGEINMRTSNLQNIVVTISWAAIALLITLNFNFIREMSSCEKDIIALSLLSFSLAIVFAYWDTSLNRDYSKRLLLFKQYALMYSDASLDKKKEFQELMNKALEKIDTKFSKNMRIIHEALKSLFFVAGLMLFISAFYYAITSEIPERSPIVNDNPVSCETPKNTSTLR